MLSPLPSSSATAAGSRPRLSAGTVLDRVTWLAVMLIIVAAGLMLLRTYRGMLRESTAAPVEKRKTVSGSIPDRDRNPQAEQIPETLLLQPGAWSLGESKWTLALIDLSDGSGETRLRSLGPAAAGEAQPSALEKKVLAWLRPHRPTIVDGCRVYEVPVEAVRVRVVTAERGGRERLRLGQILWSRDGSVQLLEAAPVPAASAKERRDGHLLPLPAGVASLARRWDDSGSLSGELLGPTNRREECLQRWSTAGWTARQVHVANSSYSVVELSRGERTIHVCSLSAGEKSSSTYLLLSAPRAANSEGNR